MGEGCRETTVWMVMQPPLGASDAYNSINSEDRSRDTRGFHVSTNVWVFSVPRIVLFGNPLKAKKKSGRLSQGVTYDAGGWGGKQARTQICTDLCTETREQNPLSHFTEGKTVTAGGWLIFAKNPAARFMATLSSELPSLHPLLWSFSGPCSVCHLLSLEEGHSSGYLTW